MNTLTNPPDGWTAVTTDRRIFDFLLIFSQNVENLWVDGIMNILQQFLNDSEDAEAKILTYINLANCIEIWNKSKCEKLGQFYEKVTKGKLTIF